MRVRLVSTQQKCFGEGGSFFSEITIQWIICEKNLAPGSRGDIGVHPIEGIWVIRTKTTDIRTLDEKHRSEGCGVSSTNHSLGRETTP